MSKSNLAKFLEKNLILVTDLKGVKSKGKMEVVLRGDKKSTASFDVKSETPGDVVLDVLFSRRNFHNVELEQKDGKIEVTYQLRTGQRPAQPRVLHIPNESIARLRDRIGAFKHFLGQSAAKEGLEGERKRAESKQGLRMRNFVDGFY